MIVYPRTQEENLFMANWMADKLGERLEAFGFNRKGEPLFQCIGFSRDDELMCVAMLYMQTVSGVIASFASTNPRWASKQNVAAWGAWIFNQLGKDRVTAMILKSNKRSRKFVEGIGFKVEGKVRKALNGEDMIVYGLLKQEHEDWLRRAFDGKQRKH
jgi:RimJ/RimL family protein N-acetyltransferase